MNLDDDLIDEFAEHTLSGVSVIVDAPDSDFSVGSEFVVAEDVQITYASKRLPLKPNEVVIVVELETGLATTYKVRQVRAIEDGKISKAGLLKVKP